MTVKLLSSTSICLWCLLSGHAVAGDIFVGRDTQAGVTISNLESGDDYVLLVSAPPDDLPQKAEVVVADGGVGSASRMIDKAVAFAPMVNDAARETNVAPGLLHAVIAVESAYNPIARSPKGAQGLMQLLPATARRYGVANAYDPRQSILGGARYLADLLSMFDQDVPLALAAYNAGEQAVLRYGRRIPPYRETSAYVPRVLGYYKAFAKHEF
jgi:soluble lytic murein transglycosylase-like protein